MQEIIDYLTYKYKPLAIIVYGSFIDGSNGENSDFDALIIADIQQQQHDRSIISSIELDVFIYPMNVFKDVVNWQNFTQINGGNIVFDTDKIAFNILCNVQNYINSLPKKTKEENNLNIEWCEKMVRRVQRNDAEGYYRWHWLLVDSLEIYCDLIGQFYFGPKKSIKLLEEMDKEGFELYKKALSTLNYDTLLNWIDYLRKKFNQQY